MHTQESLNDKIIPASAGANVQRAGKKAVFQLVDNRPQSVIRRKQVNDLTQNQVSGLPIQRVVNNTGLPDQLKSGIEQLSGHTMDDVKVHYNSSQPAQLNAHAYAQGTNIHLAPGQEKHLPHEAWHVVQQKQGRVKPTLQMKGKVNINDDQHLEMEADMMGRRAIQLLKKESSAISKANFVPANIVQRQWIDEGKHMQWNELLNGVQWFYLKEGENKGEMYYVIKDESAIKMADLETVKKLNGKPKPRKFWVANSLFGDVYANLNAKVITPEEAGHLVPGKSLTEDFLKTYPEQISKLLSEVPPLTHIISQLIATERMYSGNHYVFYHALSNSARVLVAYHKAKSTYENKIDHILKYLRGPDLFADKGAPQELSDAGKELVKPAGDHGKIRSHLIALSLSLFSNFHLKGESTFNLFVNNINISTPWEDIIAAKLPKFTNRKWWQAYTALKANKETSGQLLQIIIPKDIAEKVILATTAGGTPIPGATIGEAVNHAAEHVVKTDEHPQGRLLLTSRVIQESMGRIIVIPYSFGGTGELDVTVAKLAAKIP